MLEGSPWVGEILTRRFAVVQRCLETRFHVVRDKVSREVLSPATVTSLRAMVQENLGVSDNRKDCNLEEGSGSAKASGFKFKISKNLTWTRQANV